jgi:hypothetical protein
MRNHRHTNDSVQNKPSLDNFSPGDALESLHAEIVEIEALAYAASEAITHYPYPTEPTARRAFARIYTLVTKVAQDTDAAVTHGQELVAALSAHLQRRRTGT